MGQKTISKFWKTCWKKVVLGSAVNDVFLRSYSTSAILSGYFFKLMEQLFFKKPTDVFVYSIQNTTTTLHGEISPEIRKNFNDF